MPAYDVIYWVKKKTVWVSYLLSLVSARPTLLFLLVSKDPEDQIKISRKNKWVQTLTKLPHKRNETSTTRSEEGWSKPKLSQLSWPIQLDVIVQYFTNPPKTFILKKMNKLIADGTRHYGDLVSMYGLLNFSSRQQRCDEMVNRTACIVNYPPERRWAAWKCGRWRLVKLKPGEWEGNDCWCSSQEIVKMKNGRDI